MVGRDIVVIGGSAGSLLPFKRLLSELPSDLPASLFVVEHAMPRPWVSELLSSVLGRVSPLPVLAAKNEQQIERGKVYVCPPDCHMRLGNEMIYLDSGPKEHHTRPSVDVLFRSAATTYGRRVIGLLLSGALSDGTAGLWLLKRRGGTAFVQDPADAEFPSMPRSAIENVQVDHILPAQFMAQKLVQVIMNSFEEQRVRARLLIVEDERLVARNLQEQLEALGYLVVGSTAEGEAAVQLAAKLQPDLVLMDIRLEGEMTGVQAARAIWDRQQIPVVFVTANADLTTLAGVKTTQSYGYVLKPFTLASLQVSVELALDRREKELRHEPAVLAV